MSQILLIDFTEEELQNLKSAGYDAELKETNWKSGRTGRLIPPEDCEIVFYSLSSAHSDSGLHVSDTNYFKKIVETGGVIVCFIGCCSPWQVINITGCDIGLNFKENKQPTSLDVVKDSPFNIIFSRFGSKISYCNSLWLGRPSLGSFNLESPGRHILAVHMGSHHPVSIYLRKQKGFYLLLPYFGKLNIDVVKLLLREILPRVSPHLFEIEEDKWLRDPQYYFPRLLKLHNRRKELEEKYKKDIAEINKKFEDAWEHEQNPFNVLLVAKGDDLKKAVIIALKNIGWKMVIDVDEYWKKKDSSRQKEEDIWLFDRSKPDIKNDEIILIEVKGSKGGTSDDDCTNLQKYKGRRMREFGHTKMKAILIGNYFCKRRAHERKNPFRDKQIEDAKSDDNGLIISYDLFNAIKLEKEGKITKEEIIKQMKEKSGLIKFKPTLHFEETLKEKK
jgi:hypothetical protein